MKEIVDMSVMNKQLYAALLEAGVPDYQKDINDNSIRSNNKNINNWC